MKITKSPVGLDLINYHMEGDPIINQTRKIKDLTGVFRDKTAFDLMDPEKLAYTVQSWLPVPDGTPGGLFFGVSTIMPGKVGSEYFMTKGHFHEKSDCAEFYWGVKGCGMLVLMDRERNTWAEEVHTGSLHYIGGEIAHRLVNTGDENLVVGACWPSDAGHDYAEIAMNGFSARLLEVEGEPRLVNNESKG